MPWENDTLRRILYQLLLSGIYTALSANLSYYLFKSFFTDFPPDAQQIILLNIYATFIVIPVFSIFFGIYFLTKWKKATIAMEEAKKEAIKSELLALKNHIDPHFLFNNLNILSSLIEPENSSAQSFLEKFAEVYRYVLKHKDSEVIVLRAELQFLEAYIYLINTRFEKQLDISVDVDERSREYYLPTLTIQMLVENALKHNNFSSKNKLQIKICTIGDHLLISNTYNPKNSKTVDDHTDGSGLKNIEKRYELISKMKPDIEISEKKFIVKLPLIKKQL
jgi:LytS/YehU family sensor histidine kinase